MIQIHPARRLLRALCLLGLAVFFVDVARADIAVLRSGRRMRILGYEELGERIRLYIPSGSMDVPASLVVAIEPEEILTLPDSDAELPFAELIREAARRHGLDARLIASVIAVESRFNPRAVSRKGARGLMQLTPATVERYNVANVYDPAENIDAGARYLKELLKKFDHNLHLALAAYNAGPDRVAQYGGVPPFRETLTYIERVTLMIRESPTQAERQ